jgi:hypothetical protein
MVLKALGDNAEDIANLLQFGGWRGLPHDAHACPIALYLRTVVTDVTEAAVSSDLATVHTSDGADIEVELTPAAAGFVLAFDVGAYPELVVTATDDNGDVIDDLDR